MMKDKLYQLAYHSDLHVTRIILAISEIIWGLSLVMPGETFTRSKTYSGMAQIASENIWGIIWLASGIIQFLIVYKNEYHSISAVWFAGLNAMLWWIVVLSLYLNVWPMNSVASGDAALCIGATWVWIRSGWVAKQMRGLE